MLVLTARLHDGHSNDDREATHVACACGRKWRFWVNKQQGSAKRVKVVIDAPHDVSIVRGEVLHRQQEATQE